MLLKWSVYSSKHRLTRRYDLKWRPSSQSVFAATASLSQYCSRSANTCWVSRSEKGSDWSSQPRDERGEASPSDENCWLDQVRNVRFWPFKECQDRTGMLVSAQYFAEGAAFVPMAAKSRCMCRCLICSVQRRLLLRNCALQDGHGNKENKEAVLTRTVEGTGKTN